MAFETFEELQAHNNSVFENSPLGKLQIQSESAINIDGLIIMDKDDSSNRRFILADQARIDNSHEAEGVLSFQLDNILDHKPEKRRRGEFEYTEAEKMEYNILLKDITNSIRNPGPREMGSLDVYKVIKKKKLELRDTVTRHKLEGFMAFVRTYGSWSQGGLEGSREAARALLAYEENLANPVRDRSLQIWELEFFQKFSIPFSCLPFVILGFPLGLFTKRSGRSVGFGIGLFITIVYWGMLVAGRTLGIRTFFSPVITMWTPNALVLILGSILYLFRAGK